MKLLLVAVLLAISNIIFASCFYNHSDFPVVFSNTGWSSGGYSGTVKPGGKQCFYNAPWKSGYILQGGSTLGDWIFNLFTDISTGPHGWVVVTGNIEHSPNGSPLVGNITGCIMGSARYTAYHEDGSPVSSFSVQNTCVVKSKSAWTDMGLDWE